MGKSLDKFKELWSGNILRDHKKISTAIGAFLILVAIRFAPVIGLLTGGMEPTIAGFLVGTYDIFTTVFLVALIGSIFGRSNGETKEDST